MREEKDVLARLELAKLATFEEDLECRPDEGRRRLRAVDRVLSVREACADGLVDVDHYIKMGVQESRMLV